MANSRIPVMERVSQSIREEVAVDVYELVAGLRKEFPEVSETKLERIVSEEVVRCRANAKWERRQE